MNCSVSVAVKGARAVVQPELITVLVRRQWLASCIVEETLHHERVAEGSGGLTAGCGNTVVCARNLPSGR